MYMKNEILVVDDNTPVRIMVEEILLSEGYVVRSADNGKTALESVADSQPQLILLDIDMPGMDGYEVCRRLQKQEGIRKIPVIFISGLLSMEEKLKSFRVGGVDFISKPFHPEELLARIRTHLELSQLRNSLELQVAQRTNQLCQLTKKLKKNSEKLRKSVDEIVQAMAIIVETRDSYTAGHQRRVAELSRAIAQEMGLPKERIDGLYMAAQIHDLGKIKVPAEILNKPSKLSEIEFRLVKTHAEAGYDILKNVDFPWPVARMVHEHHERVNGSGYPNGLTGENILPESHILVIADVVEAISSFRPHRPSNGVEAALDEIENNQGILYESATVQASLRLFRDKDFKFD
jgi:putative two-component system response regulator